MIRPHNMQNPVDKKPGPKEDAGVDLRKIINAYQYMDRMKREAELATSRLKGAKEHLVKCIQSATQGMPLFAGVPDDLEKSA